MNDLCLTKYKIIMDTETIGTYAGDVWQALNVAEALGVKQLKKITKLKEKELYAALGWLACERKLVFAPDPDDEKGFIVSLIR